MTLSLILKWSRVGFLDLPIIVLRVVWECRRNIKHQLMMETSHLVMETHANSTPVQVYATCYVLTKEQGKGTLALPKNLAKAFEDYLAKEGCLEDPFSKQTLRNYQPLCIYPETPEQHKECVNQQHAV